MNTGSAVTWQIVCCAAVTGAWYIVQWLCAATSRDFRSLPDYRQTYVCKNAVKALTLFLMTPAALEYMYQVVFNNLWRQDRTVMLGAAYAANDIVGLAMIGRKLPTTTLAHHTCVCIFAVANSLWIDYTDENSLWRHIAMCAACSTPTYVVNLYLGERLVVFDASALAKFAMQVYAPFIALSMWWQALVVWSFGVTLSTIVYTTMISFIFWDDMILLRHLWRAAHTSKSVYRGLDKLEGVSN